MVLHLLPFSFWHRLLLQYQCFRLSTVCVCLLGRSPRPHRAQGGYLQSLHSSRAPGFFECSRNRRQPVFSTSMDKLHSSQHFCAHVLQNTLLFGPPVRANSDIDLEQPHALHTCSSSGRLLLHLGNSVQYQIGRVSTMYFASCRGLSVMPQDEQVG